MRDGVHDDRFATFGLCLVLEGAGFLNGGIQEVWDLRDHSDREGHGENAIDAMDAQMIYPMRSWFR